MVEYKCIRCGYKTPIVTKFINHLNRKFVCSPKIIDIEISICKRIFFHQYIYDHGDKAKTWNILLSIQNIDDIVKEYHESNGTR